MSAHWGGGSGGGRARANILTPERRSEIARLAAVKRWSNPQIVVSRLPKTESAWAQKTAFVYIMSAGDAIQKIGVATDPKKRLKQIQYGCPFKVELIFFQEMAKAGVVERWALFALREYKLRGEWVGTSREIVLNAVLFEISRIRGGDYGESPRLIRGPNGPRGRHKPRASKQPK